MLILDLAVSLAVIIMPKVGITLHMIYVSKAAVPVHFDIADFQVSKH